MPQQRSYCQLTGLGDGKSFFFRDLALIVAVHAPVGNPYIHSYMGSINWTSWAFCFVFFCFVFFKKRYELEGTFIGWWTWGRTGGINDIILFH